MHMKLICFGNIYVFHRCIPILTTVSTNCFWSLIEKPIGICGQIIITIEIHENPLKHAKIHENLFKFGNKSSKLRKFMKFHENPGKSTKIRENPRKSRKNRENSRKSRKIIELVKENLDSTRNLFTFHRKHWNIFENSIFSQKNRH